MKLSSVKVIPEYTRFKGGLVLSEPPLSISPGALIASKNYVSNSSGGYRRIDGFEAYDGRPSPSDADYYLCLMSDTSGVAVGNTVTGVVSGETGVVANIVTNDHINIVKVSGAFDAEAITVGGSPAGTFTAVPTLNDENTGLANATALNAAADIYRADIVKATGSGAVRGIAVLKGDVYCFRDNAGGTAGLVYKATTSGWSAVTLYSELSFDTGIAVINDGDTITQLVSTATAEVKRVVLESGTWSGGDAEGRLIIGSIVGTFDATHDLQVAAATKATSTSTVSAITISPGGRYELENYNFSGSADKERIYGCDGVNRGFEFDGSIYVPISTGMEVDVPEHVWTYKQQLFFSFKASSQNSSVGTAYSFTPLTGADQIALGDTINGYISLTKNALGIVSKNSSHQLIGNNKADFQLDEINSSIGGLAYTLQKLEHAFAFDAQGVVRLTDTDAFGGINAKVVSRKIKTAIANISSKVIASAVYKEYNQYRVYTNDGLGLNTTIMDDGSFEFSLFEYPINVACTAGGKNSDGEEVVFIGDDEGNVYQANKGSSFNGEAIEAFFVTAFKNSKSPTVSKTYRKGTVEMTAEGYAEIKFTPEFSFSDPAISEHVTKQENVVGKGGYWDVDDWESFFYDVKVVAQPEFSIQGTGTNIGIICYSNTDIDLGHKIDGIVLHYTPRRLKR